MKKSILSILVLASVGANAVSQPNTFYVGAKVGGNRFHDGINQFHEMHTSPFSGMTVNRNSPVFSVLGGYQITKSISTELELGHAGKFAAWKEDKSTIFKQSSNSLALSLKYAHPVSEKLDLFGRFGTALVKTNYKTTKDTKDTNGSFRSTTWVAAVGAEYNVKSNLGLTLEFQYLNNVGNTTLAFSTEQVPFFRPDAGSVTLGVVYRFGQKHMDHQEMMMPKQTEMMKHEKPMMSDKFSFNTDIFFESASAELTADSKTILKNAKKKIDEAKVKDLKIKLSGFADRTGNKEFNMMLSQKRADMIAKYLEMHGIAKSSIMSKGFGVANSITGESCVAVKEKADLNRCLGPDRRVEVKIEGMISK